MEQALSRRRLLHLSAAAAATSASRTLLFARGRGIRVGVTDWNLRLASRPEALGLAKRIGFAGIQVSLGRQPSRGKLLLADSKMQLLYQAESMKTEMPINATCLDILHVNFLKSDKVALQWVAEGIEATKGLEAQVMLLPFFNQGAIETQAEKEYVADALRELAPTAEKAKVILALENTLSAADNAWILDRTKSKAVQVYYDTYNSQKAGYDIYKEIRWLTAKRIAQVHFKDKGYLGEGEVDFNRVVRSLADADYKGWANLETPSPSGAIEADMRRNLIFIKGVIDRAPKA
ncbi:MAG: sugar phosphate isomerase/epimerase [Acidobacteria bacterium]|nr:sugar phosphate isomerase/epimerase [Acidobacteriota bacterium]